MINIPDQVLYDDIFRASETLGYTTYDFLPPEGTEYPFVVVGGIQTILSPTKSRLRARVVASVDVWGKDDSRKDITVMGHNLVRVLHTDSYNKPYRVMLQEVMIDTIQDDSTPENLWRCRLEIPITYN